MSAVQSEYVIASLRRQLSDQALKIAILEAELMQVGAAAPPAQEPVLVVPDVPSDNGGSAGEPEAALD